MKLQRFRSDRFQHFICMPSASCSLCMISDRKPSSQDQYIIHICLHHRLATETAYSTLPLILNIAPHVLVWTLPLYIQRCVLALPVKGCVFLYSYSHCSAPLVSFAFIAWASVMLKVDTGYSTEVFMNGNFQIWQIFITGFQYSVFLKNIKDCVWTYLINLPGFCCTIHCEKHGRRACFSSWYLYHNLIKIILQRMSCSNICCCHLVGGGELLTCCQLTLVFVSSPSLIASCRPDDDSGSAPL